MNERGGKEEGREREEADYFIMSGRCWEGEREGGSERR